MNLPLVNTHIIHAFPEILDILTVAHKKKGIRPIVRSCLIASSSDSGERA